MVIVLSLILAILLSVAFTSAGFAKVTDQPVMIRARDHLGLTADVYRAVGLAELAGALGVLLGLLDLFVWVGFFAAVGLCSLMVAAVGYHLRVHDQAQELVPALAMAGLSALYLTTVAFS